MLRARQVFIRKLKPKQLKKRRIRKKPYRHSRSSNVHRCWTLATRLEHRRIK